MAETSNGQGERGITALFVRRPVLAFVINTLIAVAGMAAFYGVEIRELPDVDRPVITVTTDYTGASAETIDRELTAVLEGAVSRVSGVKAISSSSSFERSRVTVEFSDGVNLDVAASDMRDAVSRVTNQLPDDIDPPRIVKADANADAVMRLAVTSDNIPVEDMTIIVEDQILDTLSAVPGVADVQVYGDRDKIFRVDVNQAKVASHGLTIADIANALETVAFDTPAGSLTTGNMDIVVRATATVNTPDAFESIIINGRTRLGDVASVTLGGDPSATSLRSDGKTGIGLGIIRAAQSNTLDISTGVRAAAAKIQETLPKGMNIRVTSDDATFINGAIHEVELALGLSVTIVLVVIYLVPARLARHADPGPRHAGRADRHDRRDLHGRLLGQHPDAAGAGAGDRPGRRRRHRGAREHRAPAQPRAWARAPPPCSAPARCSSPSSRPPRRSPPCSSRYRSCPDRPAGCSANSASCWRCRYCCRRSWRCRFARCWHRAC